MDWGYTQQKDRWDNPVRKRLEEIENQKKNPSNDRSTDNITLEAELEQKNKMVDEYETTILELMIELDQLRNK